MNAHDLKQPPYTEWTFQQKYQRMRPRDLIEVRLDQPGCDPKWVQARIKDTNKGGCFVKVVNGHLERFFKFSECRPCMQADTQKPIATLGEVAKGQLPTLQAPPPPAQKPLPVFAAPQQSAPPAPPQRPELPAPAPSLVLFRREDPNMRQDKPRDPHPPTDGKGRILTSQGFARALPNRTSNDPRARPTRVGALIQETRKRRGITQLGLADLSSQKSRARDKSTIYNSQVSKIELGIVLPNDDEMLGIAEALDLSLDQMIDLRDLDRSEREAEAKAIKEAAEKEREREERAAREVRDAVRRSNVIPNAHAPMQSRYIEPPRIQKTTTQQPPVYYEPPAQTTEIRTAEPEPQRAITPAPIVAMQVEFAEFVENVIGLVPMPVDSELRKRWFACVMELYKLSGCAS